MGTGRASRKATSTVLYRTAKILVVCAGLFLLRPWSAPAGEIRFSRSSQWREWSAPEGTIAISPDGRVSPVFIRKSINAALNADQFAVLGDFGDEEERLGGISGAGTNPGMAGLILDGDEETFWTPAVGAALDDWWVEVDLGRAVSATEIAVKFARSGNPFSMFQVFVSTGEEAVYFGSGLKKYSLLAETTRPNTRYELTYPLLPQDVKLSGRGELTFRQFVRFVLFRALRTAENPRLAEIEVRALGDNIVLGSEQRGGGALIAPAGGDESEPPTFASDIIDGNYNTGWNSLGNFVGDPKRWGWVNIDLGTLFRVDHVRIITSFEFTGKRNVPVFGYKLFASDGTRSSGAGAGEFVDFDDLVWEEIAELEDNPAPERFIFEEHLTPRKVRYLFWSNRNQRGTGVSTVREIQAFGEGFIPGVTLTSGLINLGGAKNLTAIHWSGETPPATRLAVRTRTGNELGEKLHYFDKEGNEYTEKAWEKLPPFKRQKEPTVELIPGAGWSPWSLPYEYSGARFQSPSPRSYAQIQVELISDDPQRAPALSSVALEFTDPAAEQIIAEIVPRIATPGQTEEFSYFILPSFGSGNRGFDQILIRVPTDPVFRGLKLDHEEIDPVAVRAAADSLVLTLPTAVQSAQLIEVNFATQVFLNATLFEGFVRRLAEPNSWQQIDPGDASPDDLGDDLRVFLPASSSGLQTPTIDPSVITPNGDGLNEQLTVRFALVGLEASRQLRAAVYDLGGRLVARLRDQSGSSGEYALLWDGRDGAGNMVPPGVYLFRLSIDSDKPTRAFTRLVGVAY